MTAMKLKFEKVFHNGYVIYSTENQRIGFIGMINNETIQHIDINMSYLRLIKQYLLNKFVQELGRDYIYIVRQNDTPYRYYAELGFRRCTNNKRKMKYSIS